MNKEKAKANLKNFIRICENHVKDERVDSDFVELTNLQKRAFETLLKIIEVDEIPTRTIDNLEVGIMWSLNGMANILNTQ